MADRTSQPRLAALLSLSPRRLAVAVLVTATAATLIATASVDNGGHRAAGGRAPTLLGSDRRSHAGSRAAVLSLEQRLSNAQLAGQRIVYAYSGLTPPPSLLARIRAGEAAGVIFFAPNISSGAQLRAVIGELQNANRSSPVHVPLLMMLDQEGGIIRRLPGAPALSEKQIGESPQGIALAEQAGTAAGDDLRSVGINVNLAPVLDVYRQAGNFIDQYQRSYSSNPAVVAQLGGTFITAQQDTGVAATAKHFPGLGAATTSQDTDAEPVALNLSLTELRTIDEARTRRR